MKLASLKAGGRDGTLLVVSRDLQRAVVAGAAAPTLQSALDRWSDVAPVLDSLYRQINEGQLKNAAAFDAHACTAPLPRAYQWLDGSGFPNHNSNSGTIARRGKVRKNCKGKLTSRRDQLDHDTASPRAVPPNAPHANPV